MKENICMNDNNGTHEIGFIAGAIAVVALGCFLLKVLKELLNWLEQVLAAAAHTSYTFGLAALSLLQTALVVALFISAIYATFYCLKKYIGLIKRVGDSDYELRRAYADFSAEVRATHVTFEERAKSRMAFLEGELYSLKEK